MSNYNIQIQDLDKSWEDTESKTVSFKTRKDAVTFCYNLSYVLDCKEIRLSEGRLEGSQGTYIKI